MSPIIPTEIDRSLNHHDFLICTSLSDFGVPTRTNRINCTNINAEAYEQKSAIQGIGPEN